jgi:AraC-like DNA-binding protein
MRPATAGGMDWLADDLYYLLMLDRGLAFIHFAHFPHCVASVDKQFEGYASLQLMTRGRLEVSYGDWSRAMSGGWMWPHYPGPRIRLHRAAGCREWNHRYVAMRGTLVEQWLEAGLLRFEPQPSRQVERAVERFDRLLALADRADRWSRLRAVNVLEGLLLDLAEARKVAAPPGLVEQVDRWMQRQGTYWPDYAVLAAELGMGLSTLRRHFRAVAGRSLHEHTLDVRVGTAARLLVESELTVKQIALQLGYGDVFFFSRQFAERIGLPPAEYRRVRRMPPGA